MSRFFAVARLTHAAAQGTALRRVAAGKALRLPVASLHTTPRNLDGRGVLLDALNQELEDEKQNGTPPRLEATWGRFVINSEPGSSIVSFEHQEGREKVLVTVDLNAVDFEPEQLDEFGQPIELPEGEEPLPVAQDIDIQIENRAGRIMQVEATLANSQIILARTGLRSTGMESADTYMTNVETLDETLHNSLAHYLAEKGVDDDFADMLSAYLQDKEYGEYLGWLDDMARFVDES